MVISRVRLRSNLDFLYSFSFVESFDDRFGNRVSTAQNVLGIANSTTPAVDQLTNRFVTAGTTFEYDLNGNLVRDHEGRQFTFNGDNKQSVVKDSNGNKVGEYFYDGEGRRVKKLVYDTNGVLQETTVFVYSSGKLIAEYSTAPLSPQPTTNYTATDMLGSPRVLTDSLGNVVSRRDFLPFGEELYADGVHRTVAGKYSQTGQDGVRQRFTGYQKDAETSLDFAEARMYANTYGRFTAVDPLLASGKSANPQTFNRYIYVLNNPLLLTDPDGLQVTSNPDEDSIKIETQLSRKAPWVGNVRVIHNGREVKNDLYVGDQFTIEWKFRINKLDDPKRIQRASTVSGVDRDRSAGFSNGKPIGTETEITEGNDSFSDAEGIKRLGDAKIVTVGARADETEVTMSQTFEIIGRKDGTPGASNQINFQITVVDPRAPLTPTRNSTKMEKGPLPANPAIFTTRTNDPRRDVTSDPSKAISYRNRKRSKEEEEEE